ncbi:MAG: hypothetical protein GDA65_05805 [Nitrospira sp. CR1.1]|jgi:hypothetical protein|nr:hypothetical protein [Nitrospira sp. CR1.1]MBX3370309.1 hypothetical protein [Nitrospira sp.]
MISLRSPSSRLIPKVFVLLLTWIVVASLSWADLIGAQAEPTGALVDAQVATELDLDELRDDATTLSLIEEELPARLSAQTLPLFSAGRSIPDENPQPTRLVLSKLSVYRL